VLELFDRMPPECAQARLGGRHYGNRRDSAVQRKESDLEARDRGNFAFEQVPGEHLAGPLAQQ
jgi:hypothetical protein